MIRLLRRSLRGWKREIYAFWGRFNTFYRIIIGLALAMAMIYGGRETLLDPRIRELKKLNEQLAKNAVPDPVPASETDDEAEESRIKAENIRKSLESLKARLADAEKATPYRLEASAADATAAVLRLADSFGLRVREASPIEDAQTAPAQKTSASAAADKETAKAAAAKKPGQVPEKPSGEKPTATPVPQKSQQFLLTGGFLSIRSFLQALSREPLLWSVSEVSLSLMLDDSGSPLRQTSGAPMLYLRFRLSLSIYRERRP